MTIIEKAHKLVEIALSTYGEMADSPWFGHHSEWSLHIRKNRKNIFGLCIFNTKEIVLDERLIQYGTWDEIKEVVLHECAHALAGIEYKNDRVIGHGKLWRTWAKRLGANPRATAKFNDELMSHYNTKPRCKYYVISIIDDKVTVHSRAGRKLKNLEVRHYPNVKNSLGNLFMIDVNDYDEGLPVDTVKAKAFR